LLFGKHLGVRGPYYGASSADAFKSAHLQVVTVLLNGARNGIPSGAIQPYW
jgi:hypothetical protein